MYMHVYRICEKIGSGQFGIVNLAIGLWSDGSPNPVQVAVNTLNSHAMFRVRQGKVSEGGSHYAHGNVIHLHGIVTEKENLMIVLEYYA